MPALTPRAAASRPRRRVFRRLRAETSGLALVEFALTLPLILTVGCWGVELSSLALCNLRVSQVALNLADNVSRVGLNVGSGVFNLRESDVNDVLQGARLQGNSFGLTSKGRIIVSSLENVQQSWDTSGPGNGKGPGGNGPPGQSANYQRIHWQRCLGLQGGTTYDSHFGTAQPTDGTVADAAHQGPSAPGGMGNPVVNAPPNGGTIFVEVNYLYTPMFGTMFMNPTPIRYVASFMVRDNRGFAQLYNPSPTATAATCDKYTAAPPSQPQA